MTKIICRSNNNNNKKFSDLRCAGQQLSKLRCVAIDHIWCDVYVGHQFVVLFVSIFILFYTALFSAFSDK